MICTFKNSFEVRKENLKEKMICPAGLEFDYVSHEHFYHAYYEVHTYKVLFHHKNDPITVSMKRIQGSKKFTVEGFKQTHADEDFKKLYWDDIFEEDCPISVN